MKTDNISSIKGFHWIYCNQKYIVLIGRDFWILRKDLSIVCHRTDVSNVFKVAFLNDDQILTGQGKKASYRLINLNDGSEIRNWPYIKMAYTMRHLALSSNKLVAYDFFCWKGKDYLVKLDLQTGDLDVSSLSQGFGATCDMICDDEDNLCLLQTQYEESDYERSLFQTQYEVSDYEPTESNYERISSNGIRTLPSTSIGKGNSYFWKHKWNHHDSRIAMFFLGNSGAILTNDLFIYEPKTERSYYLLENEPNWKPPARIPSDCWSDEDKRFVFLMYDRENVVIDRAGRKVIARYKGKIARGCLVGNEYWITSENGIRRLPFPLIEQIDYRKESPFGDKGNLFG